VVITEKRASEEYLSCKQKLVGFPTEVRRRSSERRAYHTLDAMDNRRRDESWRKEQRERRMRLRASNGESDAKRLGRKM
jgi:hypothetical protein